MKTKFAFVLSMFFLFPLFGFQAAKACSCMSQEVCQFYSDAKVVFVGKVLESNDITRNVPERILRIRPEGKKWEDVERIERRQISRLQITESFAGTNGRKEILIETEIGSSCAFPLARDTSYVIYASQPEKEENLMTGFCSGTKAVEWAQEDLAYLRANKDKNAVVTGKVGFGNWGNLNPSALLPNKIRTVSLENENTKLSADIDENGRYAFRDVPAGKYKIKVNLPNLFVNIDPYNPVVAEELEIGDQSIVDVSRHGCLIRDFLIARKRKPRRK